MRDALPITGVVATATTVIAITVGIVVGCNHANDNATKARVACNEAVGKQWINGNCLVAGGQE